MDVRIQQQLLDLNRAFYDRFAQSFADSRTITQPSLLDILKPVGDGATVLDVGCGDGRAARALAWLGRHVTYLGIDASPLMVALARARMPTLSPVTASFAVIDVTQADWLDRLPQRAFDHVLALAVLHHIPGRARRAHLVQQLASLLPLQGRLVLSVWQFHRSERLRRKIVPWATLGLDESQVDEGDFLLDWRRDGYGLRYCHRIDEDTLRALCQAAGLSVQRLYLADNGLNLYAIATR